MPNNTKRFNKETEVSRISIGLWGVDKMDITWQDIADGCEQNQTRLEAADQLVGDLTRLVSREICDNNGRGCPMVERVDELLTVYRDTLKASNP